MSASAGPGSLRQVRPISEVDDTPCRSPTASIAPVASVRLTQTGEESTGSACLSTGYRDGVTRQQVHGVLPALAGPDASADERERAIVARMVARHGAPSINDYRRVYDSCGVQWPGDEEIRRRYPVGSA